MIAARDTSADTVVLSTVSCRDLEFNSDTTTSDFWTVDYRQCVAAMGAIPINRRRSDYTMLAVPGVECALESTLDLCESPPVVNGSRRRKQAGAMLVFGAAGPLSHILPHYLSRAVSKRLQSLCIQVLDRSLVRYIGHHNGGHPNKTHNSSSRPLQFYTAKSFDFLDGATTAVDWVVVAPAVQGARGTTDQLHRFFNRI
jgi:hypothetical protein